MCIKKKKVEKHYAIFQISGKYGDSYAILSVGNNTKLNIHEIPGLT